MVFADLVDPSRMVPIPSQQIGGDQMPRYFFHIRDGWDVIPDCEGMEFPSFTLAEVEGYASARDLAAAALDEGRTTAAYAIEVADESGTVLRRIKIEMIYRAAS
jgi:hypothetical protein